MNIMVTHLQRFRGLALSCDWLTRWVKLMTLMPVEKPRLMDHQPCLSKLHWIRFNIELMSFTFSSGTQQSIWQWAKDTKDRRVECNSFYDKKRQVFFSKKEAQERNSFFRTHKYETVISVMTSKGLIIDLMEFHIYFSGLQNEKWM